MEVGSETKGESEYAQAREREEKKCERKRNRKRERNRERAKQRERKKRGKVEDRESVCVRKEREGHLLIFGVTGVVKEIFMCVFIKSLCVCVCDRVCVCLCAHARDRVTF